MRALASEGATRSISEWLGSSGGDSSGAESGVGRGPGPGEGRDGAPSTEFDEDDLDVLLEILKNRRRRIVLNLVAEREAETDISVLAEHIAAAENGKDVDAVTTTERKRVYVALHQCHLPKMAQAGAVSFRKDRGLVGPGRGTQRYVAALDVLRGEDEGSTFARGVVLGGVGALGFLLVLEAMLGDAAPLIGMVALGLGAVVMLSQADLAWPTW